MDNLYKPKFLLPADPKNFVGQRKLVNEFRKTMMKIKSTSKSKNNIIFVIGETGSGKSSLLNVFEKTAEAEKILAIRFNFPSRIESTLKEVNELILKFKIEEKSGMFSKKRKEVNVPHLRNIDGIDATVNAVYTNLADRQFEKNLLITIDDIDLLFEIPATYILDGLIKLAEKILEKIPVTFVFTISQTRWDQIQNKYGNHSNMLIDRFEFSEAEILIRKIGNEVFEDSEFRAEVIKLGDRSPFNIVFSTDVISYFTKEIAENIEEISNAELDLIKEKSIPYLRDIDYFGFISKTYQLNDANIRLLEKLLSKKPILLKSELIQMGIDPLTLNSSGISELIHQFGDKYYRFSSFSFFEKAGRKSEIDILSQIELLSNFIAMDYKEGYKPTQTSLSRLLDLTELIKGEDEPNAKPIATKLEQLFKIALNSNQFFAAYKFSLATEKVFGACGDQEGRGLFLEEAARKFIDSQKLHYAKDLFEKSIEVFSHSEWKMKSSARESANIYSDLAKQAQKNNHNQLMRAFLWKAIQLYDKAGEKERKDSIIKRVIDTYQNREAVESKFFVDLSEVKL